MILALPHIRSQDEGVGYCFINQQKCQQGRAADKKKPHREGAAGDDQGCKIKQ
jgi:hypothetical protein